MWSQRWWLLYRNKNLAIPSEEIDINLLALNIPDGFKTHFTFLKLLPLLSLRSDFFYCNIKDLWIVIVGLLSLWWNLLKTRLANKLNNHLPIYAWNFPKYFLDLSIPRAKSWPHLIPWYQIWHFLTSNPASNLVKTDLCTCIFSTANIFAV